MNNRDWKQIKIELQATVFRNSTETAIKKPVQQRKADRISGNGTEAALDQIAKALRRSED